MIINPYVYAVPASGYTDWRLYVTDNNGSASFIEVVELKFYDSVGTLIPATGGTALKSSEGLGNEATKAFDGTTSSWATATVTNSYIGYSFPTPKNVAKVGITCPNTPDRAPKNCKLEYYNGSSWVTLETFALYLPLVQHERIFPESTPPGYHKAWRLFVTSTTGGTQTQIVEMEFRATSGGADQTAVLTTNNGSASGRVIVSGDGAGNEGYRAYDGVLTTSTGWFQASGANTYNAFVFPSPVTVTEVTVLGSSNTNRSPSALKIQYTDDGVTWTDAKTSTGLSWTAGETKTFSIP